MFFLLWWEVEWKARGMVGRVRYMMSESTYLLGRLLSFSLDKQNFTCKTWTAVDADEQGDDIQIHLL
jgi:hypothetical protein